MRTREDVVKAFTYMAPNENRRPLHEQVNALTKDVALDLFDILPECPERTLVMRSIAEARMLANSAIALHVE